MLYNTSKEKFFFFQHAQVMLNTLNVWTFVDFNQKDYYLVTIKLIRSSVMGSFRCACHNNYFLKWDLYFHDVFSLFYNSLRVFFLHIGVFMQDVLYYMFRDYWRIHLIF